MLKIRGLMHVGIRSTITYMYSNMYQCIHIGHTYLKTHAHVSVKLMTLNTCVGLSTVVQFCDPLRVFI